jgi:ketosteroid isomerase-like protein
MTDGNRGSASEREPEALAREYYRAIDAGAYDTLGELLAPGFVQERGDRRLEGRETFVRFMREERPVTDTTHDVEAVYDGPEGVAVRGRLLNPDGSEWFEFVDAFDVADGRLARLRTFTR